MALHLFKAVTYPDDGTVECLVCGRRRGEPPTGECRDEIPMPQPPQATRRPRPPKQHAHAAVDAPQTSLEAAEAAVPTSATKQTRVLAIIVDRVSVGATDDEIETLTGWSHQTVSARRRELAQAHMIEVATDQGGLPQRRLTRLDRAAQVWVATALGRDALTDELRAGAA